MYILLVIRSTNMGRRENINKKRNGVTNFRISHLFDCSVRTA